MPPASFLLAAISLAIWLYLTTARGAFWRISPFDDDQAKHESPANWPRVIAIVPARNEDESISQTISALLQQDYPGEFSVIVVDDHSEDETSQIARQTAKENAAESRIQIKSASPLPPGWTGKLWALNEGIFASSNMSSRAERGGCAPDESAERAVGAPAGFAERGICFSPQPLVEAMSLREGTASAVPNSDATRGALAPGGNQPTYYWFTDADVIHAPDTLRRLVTRAEQNKLDLTSLMVLLRAKTLPERALIPAFLFFFLKLYPPRWTADPKSRTAGAAGGCVLLRQEALDRIGGLAAIRGEVIDDCALARAVKRSDGQIWMGVTRVSFSLRAYVTFSEIRDMIARTAFTQLRYSTALLLSTLAGLFVTYLAPVALLFAHDPFSRLLALITWFVMSLVLLPTIRFYRLPPFWAPLLPFTALFYAYATWLSAARYWLNRGAQWKGRAQAPRQA